VQTSPSRTSSALAFFGPSFPTSSSWSSSSAASKLVAVARSPGRSLRAEASSSSNASAGMSPAALMTAAATVAAAAAAIPRGRKRLQRAGRSGLVAMSAKTSRAAGAGSSSGEELFDVVVVGGGASGLTTAHRVLRELPGAKVAVTEAKDRAGGNVTTRTGNGRIWEEGPNSFQPGDAILTTACDVGLRDDILLANPGSYRFVWWEGALRALPATPMDAVFGDFLSLPGKIRAGLGAIGLGRDPMPEHEESVKEFVSRNLGEEAFQRLIDPFVSGVYAGDPSTLSSVSATGRVQILEKEGGSLVAGALKLFQKMDKDKREKPPRDSRLPEIKGQTVGSFRNGLSQFVDALTADISKNGCEVRLEWKLKKLSWDAQTKEHTLEYDTPSGPARLRSKSIVLTAPSFVTAELLRDLSGKSADALAEVKYPCVAAVTVEYPKSAFREPAHGKGIVNGFGQLHPRTQGIRTLGTIYSSSLFPNRMPDPDKVLLLHYIGGMQDQRLFGGITDLSEGELVEATHKDTVKTMLHADQAGKLPTALGVRVWPRAIPQLEVGHGKRLEACKQGLEEAGIQGLYLAGNYVGGVALGRCVEFGVEIAAEVVSFVKAGQHKHEHH